MTAPLVKARQALLPLNLTGRSRTALWFCRFATPATLSVVAGAFLAWTLISGQS